MAGILCWNATPWQVWSEIWEVPQKRQHFSYYSENREARKKKACQTKEEYDICLLIITYKCPRERKPVQKYLCGL